MTGLPHHHASRGRRARRHGALLSLLIGLSWSGSFAEAGATDGIEILGPLDGSLDGLTADEIVAIDAGPLHALLLLENGTVRGLGNNSVRRSWEWEICGQTDPPVDVGLKQPVVEVTAGMMHSMALLADGSVVCWGCDEPACAVPDDLAGRAGDGPDDPAVMIAAGNGFSLALLASGAISCWGDSPESDPCEIPEEAQDPTNPPVRILARLDSCAAVLADGSVVSWGEFMAVPEASTKDRVVIDAALSLPVGGGNPRLSLLLDDGRLLDPEGTLTFDPENPCVSIEPGPSTIARLADGQWFMLGEQDFGQGSFALPGTHGTTRRPVSLAAGGLEYIITLPRPLDCDEDGIADRDQIAADPSLDCNRDGRLDACEPDQHWYDRGVLSSTGVDLDLSHLPATDDPVTLFFEAAADLQDPKEFTLLEWNGIAVATAFDGETAIADCEDRVDAVVLPPRIWNDLDSDGRRLLTVSSSLRVDPLGCGSEPATFELTIALRPTTPRHDCNGNGIDDDCEIADGLADDLDGDRTPDECQPDCDDDDLPDAWAVFEHLVPDCNGNGVPDSCDVVSGRAVDANDNGVPDECETDCNDNGVPDDIDLEEGTSNDVDGDTIPDECQPDCNGNGLPDRWEIETGLADDCDDDLVIDECAVADGTAIDCNDNGIPDRCEKGRPGDQGNGDLDGDGCVGPADLGILLSLWGSIDPLCGDLDGDGQVAGSDLGILFVNWDCP